MPPLKKAVLMLYKDGNFFIQATCTAEEIQADVLQSLPVEISQDLPVAIADN